MQSKTSQSGENQRIMEMKSSKTTNSTIGALSIKMGRASTSLTTRLTMESNQRTGSTPKGARMQSLRRLETIRHPPQGTFSLHIQ